MLSKDISDALNFFFENSTCIAVREPKLSKMGSDIDCISLNIRKDIILLADYCNLKLKLKLKIKRRGRYHYHVDFYSYGQYIDLLNLIIRLDLYELQGCFSSFSIKSSRYYSFFDTSKYTCFDSLSIRLLSRRNVLVFRYLEFIDKFAIYPSKFSHYDYLVKTLSIDEFNQLVIDVHDIVEISPVSKIQNIYCSLRIILYKINNAVRRLFRLFLSHALKNLNL